MDPDFEGQTLQVVVSAKLVEESTCTGTCNFQYTTGATGSIPALDMQYYTVGTEVTITGGTLLNAGSGVEIHVDNGENHTATVVSASEIKFTVPNLVAGYYTFLVNVIGKGYVGAIPVNIEFFIYEVIPSTAISTWGENIIIRGTGFNPDTDVVNIKGVGVCDIISMTP